ncbi:MAG TPA: hypothetical protein VGU46_08440 [Acidobacteriaceae bacterium]|nr:hypothetical protein [Acidobacteriaceae bacterium]
MTTPFKYPTEYFLQEGRENLVRCLDATFEAAVAHNVAKIVIFTSAGKGVRMAVKDYLSQEKYSGIRIIAVTFPSHTKLPAGDPNDHCIQGETTEFLADHSIPVVRAHLPFEPIRSHNAGDGLLGQDFSLIDNALRIFCGSMSLCVQAVLMASDAGYVDFGEHVMAMTSDTSILVRAATTSRFLTDFIVREIICKPVLLTVIKSEKPAPVLGSPTDEKQPATLDLAAASSPDGKG